jgi:hypothetical protein
VGLLSALGVAAPGPGEDVSAVGGVRQVQQVGALGVIELQHAGDCFEDGRGDAGEIASLEFGVVLDAHVGQRSDLTAAQPGHTPSGSCRQSCLLGADLRSPRGEELADLLTVVHAFDGTTRPT